MRRLQEILWFTHPRHPWRGNWHLQDTSMAQRGSNATLRSVGSWKSTPDFCDIFHFRAQQDGMYPGCMCNIECNFDRFFQYLIIKTKNRWMRSHNFTMFKSSYGLPWAFPVFFRLIVTTWVLLSVQNEQRRLPLLFRTLLGNWGGTNLDTIVIVHQGSSQHH